MLEQDNRALYLKQVRMPQSEGWLWVFRAGVGFIMLGSLLTQIAFYTDHWHDDNVVNFGLWHSCSGGSCSSIDDPAAYHVATQAFQVMTLIAYGLSPIIHFLVYCTKKNSDKGCRTRIFDIGFSIGVTFHLISILVFSLEVPDPENMSWSFRLSAAGVGLGILGVLLVIISRNKALHRFGFCGNSQRGRRKGRVGVSGAGNNSPSSSRTGTPAGSDPARTRSKNTFGPQVRTSHHRNSQQPVNVSVNIHSFPPQQQTHFSTTQSGVPYPHSYGQAYPQGSYGSHPPVNPQPYPSDPAYPPPQPYANPPSSSSGGLAPLRVPTTMQHVQPSAPPPYGDVITSTNSYGGGAQYDPSKSDNWVGS